MPAQVWRRIRTLKAGPSSPGALGCAAEGVDPVSLCAARQSLALWELANVEKLGVVPALPTHSMLTRLKVGEAVYQADKLHQAF